MLPLTPPPARTLPDPSSPRPPLLRVGHGDAHARCLRRDERLAHVNTLLTLALLLVWLWLGVHTFRLEAALQDAAAAGCSAVGSASTFAGPKP